MDITLGRTGQGGCAGEICSRGDFLGRRRRARAVQCAVSLIPVGPFMRPKDHRGLEHPEMLRERRETKVQL